MKTVVMTLTCLALLTIACTGTQQSGTGTRQGTADADAELIRKYQKEGFLDRNTFVAIIIRPEGSGSTDADIESQLKNRTLSALLKYVADAGKTVTPNTRARALNLISEAGSVKRIADRSNKRTVFVMELRKDNLRDQLSEL
jgi:hypothetical protein